MGRPLNKRFFQSGTGASGFQVGCNAWFEGEGAAESSYIISQRSNSHYLVGSDAGGATPTRTEVLRLVDGAPAAAGEMQVEVQPENAVAVRQATVNVTAVAGAITVLTIADAGYGYWAPGTGVAIAGGTGGTADYTVDGNGSLATVTRNNDGSGYADGPAVQNISATQLADPPLQSARIINAKTVKTFPAIGGNTYLWPIVGTDDGAGPSGRTEADLQAAT